MKSAKEKERELIIKLYNEKKTCREIASLLGTSKSKVSYWICNSKKRKKFSDLPRSGRPTKLSRRKLNEVYSILRTEEQNNKYSGFSSKKVAELLEFNTGNKYTLRHVRRILNKMNITRITPRVSHIKRDEKKIKKFRKEFKKNFNMNIWTTNSLPSTKLDLD
ncbi:MAG: helix-turn-helix domain-containing protein [Candidatus Woesearchaeota archaeon]